jgi:general transcription factor 3C polypeptide 5 (transcription factor C subunit 1)
MKLIFRIRSDGQSEFIGTTSSIDTYTQMADFVYNPPNPETHIHTMTISSQATPVQYNFDPNPSTAGDSPALPPLACLRYSDKDGAPVGPPADDSLAMTPEDAQVISAIQSLLQSKPVWQRSSLETAVGTHQISSWRFSHLVRKCAYLFLDGPWRNTYIRFGYDPRTDPESRVWQMIDFRAPRTPRAASISQTDNQTARSQLIQLSDIDDPVVKGILRKNPSTCDSHTGWLSTDDIKTIRNQMKILKVSPSLANVV